MGRPRKSKPDNRLPPYVYLAKGRFVYRQYLGRGKLGKETVLCNEGSSLSSIWAAYDAVTKEENRHVFSSLANRYFDSPKFNSLSERTKKDYKNYYNRLLVTKLTNGLSFTELDISHITPGVIRKYLDKRSAKTQGNREVALISTIYSWAVERDMAKANPCSSVTRNREQARTRYITDDEYALVYDLAPTYIKAAMEIAYLCMARRQDALNLVKSNLLEKGIYIRQGKTGKQQIKLWSERLVAAIELATSIYPDNPSKYVIQTKDGDKINSSTFSTAWQRLINKALNAGLSETFTFHDIKAKGISDYEGDKMKASGHQSLSMVRRYDRKIDEVEPTR